LQKTATICLLLLLLLVTSPFMVINPVKATPTDLYDVFSAKEYKQWSSYNPSYTFSKSSSSVLQAMSTDAGNGDAYIMMSFDRDYLDGKKLQIYWRWYLDWTNAYYTLSEVYVVDHNHSRRLMNSGEFRTEGGAQIPVTDYNYITACSYGATCNGGWIDWDTDTSPVLDLSGFYSDIVTVMIKAYDPWIADTTGLQIDYLRVLDSSDTVLKEYHFTGNVFMEQTSTYYDYGLIRNPTMVSWGTTDYPEESGGDDEKNLSGDVSSYVYDLFYGTGKYLYCEDYWGANTQPSYVYTSAEYSETYYDYSVIIYKGHYWWAQDENDCGTGCSDHHWGIADNEGYPGGDFIKDYYIHRNIDDGKDTSHKTRGTHDLVFLWSCVEGDSSRVGYITSTDALGMLASWMDIDDPCNQLEEYGYASPDNSDHVFIGFTWISPCYLYTGQAPNRYLSQFVYQFFYYALQGYSVKDSLDQASYFVNGGSISFGQSNLYNNQMVWNSLYDQWDYTQMRVWGDGNHKLPR
jgi:hypothetical protein